jgi:hypothetical protein
MKKVIKDILLIGLLFSASLAFAIEPSTYSTQSYAEFAAQKTTNAPAITAFQGIESNTVSTQDAEKISGEFAPIVYVLAIRAGLLAQSAVIACTRSLSCQKRVSQAVDKFCSRVRC